MRGPRWGNRQFSNIFDVFRHFPKVVPTGLPGGQNVATPRESLWALSRGSQLPYRAKFENWPQQIKKSNVPVFSLLARDGRGPINWLVRWLAGQFEGGPAGWAILSTHTSAWAQACVLKMFDVFNTPVLYIRQREVPLGFVDVFNIIHHYISLADPAHLQDFLA